MSFVLCSGVMCSHARLAFKEVRILRMEGVESRTFTHLGCLIDGSLQRVMRLAELKMLEVGAAK